MADVQGSPFSDDGNLRHFYTPSAHPTKDIWQHLEIGPILSMQPSLTWNACFTCLHIQTHLFGGSMIRTIKEDGYLGV